MDPLREAVRRDTFGPALEGPSAEDGSGVSWSWADLDAAADRAALLLAESGVGPGEAVAFVLPPSPEAVVLLHAVPRIGGLVLPLNPGWPAAELGRALAAIGRPRLLLAPGKRVAALRKALPGVGTVAVEEVAPTGADGSPPEPIDPTLRGAIPQLAPETPVAVLLTSGSTGAPRPVALTHGNLMASARGVSRRLRLDPMDSWVASLSPAHVGGFALLHRAAVVGCPVVTRPRFDAGELLELADRGDVTHASMVPTMLRQVLRERGERPAPRGFRCVLLGGAATPAPLLREALEKRWPVALTYGLTEATSQVATAAPDEVRTKPGSVGRPLPGVGVRIGTRRDDQAGELLVRGPTVAPIAPVPSDAGERAGGEPTEAPSVWVDRAGWLHTGDLARVDPDGDLWIVGRISDRIVSGGVTVEPAEVEAVLLEHPAVGEVAVTGTPDPEWGERIVAVVAPADPAAPPTLEELLEHARARLAAAKRPRELRTVSSLPRTATGKVDRARLRAALEQPTSGRTP
jgi:o-succinylbenzoate---CoA ligase